MQKISPLQIVSSFGVILHSLWVQSPAPTLIKRHIDHQLLSNYKNAAVFSKF